MVINLKVGWQRGLYAPNISYLRPKLSDLKNINFHKIGGSQWVREGQIGQISTSGVLTSGKMCLLPQKDTDTIMSGVPLLFQLFHYKVNSQMGGLGP